MQQQHFNTTLLVDQSPEEVFRAINNVQGWWSQDFKGASQQLNDVFEVRFGDVHYSQHRLTGLIPGQKIGWLTTDSRISFVRDKSEWTGTHIHFDISTTAEGQTQLRFAHEGLVPEIECFQDCAKGWNHFLSSLHQLITTSKGQPHIPATQP